MGAMCGIMGSIQTTEILKEIMGIGDSMSGSLMVVDGLATEFRKIKVKADAGCPYAAPTPPSKICHCMKTLLPAVARSMPEHHPPRNFLLWSHRARSKRSTMRW